MKKLFFILFAAFMTITVHGQQFQKGTTAINAGIGLGTALGGLGKARPAIAIAVDHGMWAVGGSGVVSLGGYVGNTGYKYNDLGYTAKWNYTIVGLRGAYHYNGLSEVPSLDVYGGAMLGYNIAKYSSDSGDDSFANTYGSGLGFSGFIGGRWFFTESIGAYAELGYGVSILNAGVTFKF
ncbi:hypothetical protein [Sphingobacterium yanglingense]|uniref:Outer membrane protein with beta-barrel domain n=1 Tax=Sphingobacterium yanglingense TaxID=1437280 RepID=A0A4R6WSV4_9SPHI|nr:hypothetical protein [Sphingobacterium yanglingense]TDQ82839.1 hypothetical protein CLV99_0061 [Sphingobacterium yanglingense]